MDVVLREANNFLFMRNNSLKLDWSTRFDICLGIAKGLAYLHEESRLRIVHRDVKASNILLDSNLNPKISDFGLAKLYDDNKTHISTHVAGTIGYLAPEYAMHGHLIKKVDVFAFGVVALGTISGRPNSAPNLEEEQIYHLEWAWNLQEQNNEADLVDLELSEFDEVEVGRLIRVALLCNQTSPISRPSMYRVVAMLSGDIEVSTQISRPGYLADWSLDILSNILSDVATIGTDSTYYDSPASTSMVGDAFPSPAKGATRPILQSYKSKGFGSYMFHFVHTKQRSTPTETSPSARVAKRARVEPELITEVTPEAPPSAPLVSSPIAEVEPSLPMPVPPSITDVGASSDALVEKEQEVKVSWDKAQEDYLGLPSLAST
ncbi:probable LRR receptor-like serine/threonine-protein kinase At1g56140 [Humulus lupulus]|uniref:probable LRR receptor-like serine/threonine-protein kinase At1g56140 n=1 Tax=Humulus lupulus TaxID=3486 RepID=UPI002B41217B|nr:probable LRR receptor-like serine/threonine-protein kinase At1g56140 [Humulus lupulus]